MKSIFGRRVQKNHTLYAQIIDDVWEFYFRDIVAGYLHKFDEGESFSIGNIRIWSDGLTLRGTLAKDIFLPWEKVRTANYQTYFSIRSSDDQANINTAFNYLEDWNTAVLHDVVRSILHAREIETY